MGDREPLAADRTLDPAFPLLAKASAELAGGDFARRVEEPRSRDELGREAGLEMGERGGVVVDEACRTSVPGVWAIGEVACIEGRVWGLIAPGYTMAETVADRLLGGSA